MAVASSGSGAWVSSFVALWAEVVLWVALCWQCGVVDLGFRGEVASFYHRYRRGYPPAVLDAVVAAFGLTRDDVAVDLGCGTGQLALPLAGRVGSVVGVDPEPDMLAYGRLAASSSVANVRWVVGSDADLPGLVGDTRVGVLTVGQALHWMDYEALFCAVRPMFRPGGGIAVVTNGVPLWLQDSDWSRSLRGCLETWVGKSLTRTCGSDADSQARYADSLAAAGYVVRSASVEYQADLDVDAVVGGVYSAMSVDLLPAPDQRPVFADLVRGALAPFEPLAEQVRVAVLTGVCGPRPSD